MMTKLRAVSDDRLTVTLATGQRRALEVIARHNNTTLAFVVRYALAEFVKCSAEDVICALNRLRAAEKAGDKAAAAAARELALKIYRRDPLGLIVRSRLS